MAEVEQEDATGSASRAPRPELLAWLAPNLCALLLLSFYLDRMLALTRDEQRTLTLAGVTAGVLVVAAGAAAWRSVLRREASPSAEDAAAEERFAALSRRPLLAAAGVAGAWFLTGALVTAALGLVHPGLHGFTVFVLLHGFASMGLFAAIFFFYGYGQALRPKVAEAASAAGDPLCRDARAPFRPIRRKLLVSILGITLVLVQAGMFVARARSDERTEAATTRLLERFLELHAETLTGADDAEVARIAAIATTHGLAHDVLVLDASSGEPLFGRAAALDDRERSRVLAQPEIGNGLELQSPSCFAWRRVDDRIAVLAIPWETVTAGTGGEVPFLVLIGLSSLVACGLALVLSGHLAEGVEALRHRIDRIAEGDLSPFPPIESDDELGRLSRALDRMVRATGETVHDLANAVERVDRIGRRVGEAAETVSRSTEAQQDGVEKAAAYLDGIGSGVAEISSSVQRLDAVADSSSRSASALSRSTQQLSETASSLSERAESVFDSIEGMVTSVGRVAEETESLGRASEETTASMQAMAGAMQRARETAEAATGLSERVVSSAEHGQRKVLETIEGMDTIRDSTETADRMMRRLAESTRRIGAILDVIDEVADETKLLALNAAIIAAQHGESGRAFAVVAEQIKRLAKRVLGHTSEIAEVVGSVQNESGDVIEAIEHGAARVATGASLAAEAGEALEEIMAASRESGDHIGEIARAVRQETHSAGHVAGLMERVNAGIDSIRTASQAQREGHEAIATASSAMREMAGELHATTLEQARGGQEIEQSTDAVRGAVKEINDSLDAQARASADLISFIETVAGGARANARVTEELLGATLELRDQNEALRRKLARLRY